MLTWIKKLLRRPPEIVNPPQHIAIIMDGNGRWAERRGLPRIAGHKRGVDALYRTVMACGELGVKYLTVYAFSTENWERPEDEVDFLMSLLSETIDKWMDELMKNQVCLKFFGRLSDLSPSLQGKISEAMRKTSLNKGLNLNVMVNYGGRAELVDALKETIKEGKNINEIEEEDITKHLYTKDIPDPDLLIRTAGEMRISNFLLWQIAYAEFFVTETLWPDFDRRELLSAIADYQKRMRKFGMVK